MKGGLGCIKYMMFFFNLLVFIAGAALLSIGIWVAVSGDSFKTIVADNPIIFNAVYIIIAVGAALFIIGFIGCCGAVKENRCLLGTFFAIILILFLLLVVGAVLAIVLRVQAEEEAKKSIQTYDSDSETADAWNTFQLTFKCCGLVDASDWEARGSLPKSCCEDQRQSFNCTKATAFDIGCKAQISHMFWIIAGVAFGILLIELMAMIFSCCLYRGIGESGSYA